MQILMHPLQNRVDVAVQTDNLATAVSSDFAWHK